MSAKDFLFAFFLLGTLFSLYGDDAAVRKQLFVFRLSASQPELSPELLSETETGLKNALAAHGKYEIVFSDFSLNYNEIGLFFEKMSSWKTTASKLPDELKFGETVMPRAAFERIASAALVIIPSIVELKLDEEKRDDNVRYKVTIKSAFDFLKLEGTAKRTTRLVETMGYDRDRKQAVTDAVRSIPLLFSYELAMLEDLKAKTAILHMEGGEAYIERGSKEGVVLGDEFEVRGSEISATGQVVTKDKGLLIVSEVTESVSVGMVLYASEDVTAGDAVEPVNRIGIEITPYAYAFIPYGLTSEVGVYAGLRLTLSKGVFTIRPLLAVEFLVYPFSLYQSWFPIRPFIGMELRLYFGRLEIAAIPMVGIEEWFALSASSTSVFMGFGLRGLVQASLLVSRDLKLFVEGGFEYWFGNRQGFLAGGGISIKL